MERSRLLSVKSAALSSRPSHLRLQMANLDATTALLYLVSCKRSSKPNPTSRLRLWPGCRKRSASVRCVVPGRKPRGRGFDERNRRLPQGPHCQRWKGQKQRLSGDHLVRWWGYSGVPAVGVCKGTKGKFVKEGVQRAREVDGNAAGEPRQQCEEVEKAVMTKKAFEKIAAGLADAIAIAKGEADPATYRVHAPADIDVLKIRRNMGLTREAFAMRFGLQLGTVRDWEQRKRRPEGAARVLLAVIETEPEAVTRALAAAARRKPRTAAPSRPPGAITASGRSASVSSGAVSHRSARSGSGGQARVSGLRVRGHR